MKKLLSVIFALLLALSLTACFEDKEKSPDDDAILQGEINSEVDEENDVSGDTEFPDEADANEEVSDGTQEIPEVFEGTKTLEFFKNHLSGGEYTMEMSTTAEGMTVKMKNAYKGDMTYTETDAGGIMSAMIIKEGYQYILDREAKTCIKMQAIEGTVQGMFAQGEEEYGTAVMTGSTEHNGKTYDYEEFTIDGDKIQYLFDGKELKFIKATVMGTESIVEMISVEKGADSELFEVPSDYELMEF